MKYYGARMKKFRQSEADATLRRSFSVIAENIHFRTRKMC